ncbi:hypothetical protein A6C57_21140 [Fibrella sp. ES10-3-2-2]|nr:hypothetical protein A6C57_21140 [Fibrella sp. ES10-3-2-2]
MNRTVEPRMKHLYFLILLVVASLRTTTRLLAKPAPAPTLHVLYVLEQDDREYGVLNMTNETNMTQIMETVQLGLGYRRRTTYLNKGTFTAAILRQTIAKLKTQPRDIIVIYYSGYGIVPTKNTVSFANWKLRNVPEKGLPVAEVEGWLTAKKVHLGLIIADCSGQFLANNGHAASVGAGMLDLRKQVLRRLFLNTCGIVKMGSSLPLLPSWVNKRYEGSVFTTAFYQGFDRMLSISTREELDRVSFQYLAERTQTYMSMTLGGLPFQQEPVLDQKSCRVAARTSAKRPSLDPLAPETLSNLLTAVVLNPQAVQTPQIRQQLLALALPDATVEVTRFTGQYYSDLKPVANSTQQFTLSEYLNRTEYTFSKMEKDSVIALSSSLWAVSVAGVEASETTPKLIKHLVIHENWLAIR